MAISSDNSVKVAKFFCRYAFVVICFMSMFLWLFCVLIFNVVRAFALANLESRSSEDDQRGGTNYYTGDYDLVRNPEELYEEE